MFDLQKSGPVLTALGQKPIDALGEAVAATRRDLAVYRSALPRFVAEASQRGLHNWIHDRMFANSLVEIDGMPEVQVIDQEPVRDLCFGSLFRVRLKGHDYRDIVAAYPTRASLDFYAQGWQPTFPTLEEVRLVAGYRWDSDLREMKEAVISLRDGREKVIWAVELVQQHGVVGVRHFEPHDLPPLPEIELGDLGSQEEPEEK